MSLSYSSSVILCLSLAAKRVFGEPLASSGLSHLFVVVGTCVTEPLPRNCHIRHNIFEVYMLKEILFQRVYFKLNLNGFVMCYFYLSFLK
jgi:hypothetical protein